MTIHIDKERDFVEIKESKNDYIFDRESMSFTRHDFGGKISIFFQKDGNIIFRVAGHAGCYTRRRTKYYPPQLMIGTLENDVFTKYYEISYTRKHAKEAKERALKLVEPTHMRNTELKHNKNATIEMLDRRLDKIFKEAPKKDVKGAIKILKWIGKNV